MPMTAEAKAAISDAIKGEKTGLRSRLLADLAESLKGAYRLDILAKSAQLPDSERTKRERLDAWVDEQSRGLSAKERRGSEDRFRAEVVSEAASTLLNRIVYLRLLEASGLRAEKLVTGGWRSGGYQAFRELAPEFVREDETEGYARLLQIVFDDLAVDLPGLFGDVGLTSLVPVPAATLRMVVEALDDQALASCWTDDTTLGWIYQYWNDPAREALDDKINAGGKIESWEIASKTQMFTERYMVEWLLQNTLGAMWFALCRKQGWTAAVEANGTLDRLEERRQGWRTRREAGDVALDALMPIESEEEQHWKYWVPQPMPEDAAAGAPERLADFKMLDPACGSGHFLVIAFDLLFALYEEEAKHRGEVAEPRLIAESIIEKNLHGIDIDPRAVQIAAAALMLKVWQRAPNATPRRVNLVAPRLRLASLSANDPARVELRETIERETGIKSKVTEEVLTALAGADHLGSLLRVDDALDAMIGVDKPFLAFRLDEGKQTMEDRAETRETLILRINAFLAHHGHGDDLGLRLRGEQLGAALRFVRLVRESQYDLVVGNPPYQGTSKMVDAKYVAKHYPKGKADLFAAFLERGLQLVREGGSSALLTMRNWMFIKQYAKLREWLLESFDLRLLGDVGWGAFREMKDNPVTMSIIRRGTATRPSVALSPTDPATRVRTGEHFRSLSAGLLCQVGRFEFSPAALDVIPERPLVYWWDEADLTTYRSGPLLGEVAPARKGICSGDDTRFVSRPWEIASNAENWAPTIKGAKGRAWIEPLSDVIRWSMNGLVYQLMEESGRGTRFQGRECYFRRGIAFSMIGAEFTARVHRHKGVFGDMGSSVFPDTLPSFVCAMNSSQSRRILESLNPGLHFQVGDVNRLPVVQIADADDIFCTIEQQFSQHEEHRESSNEFKRPGPSPWRHAQEWAQVAVDRPEGEPLPPYTEELDPEPPTDHLSFAVGVALGRFSASGEGILDEAPATALPNGILFLSSASEDDDLAQPASKPLLAAWAEHGAAIEPKRSLKSYLQTKFFGDVHRKMYDSRPIYFPLSSAKKSFVAYVSIHRWTEGTLRALLAEHLRPALARLEGEIADLRVVRQGADAKASREAERRHADVEGWREELKEFIGLVELCAEKGPSSPDSKTPEREVDARYAPDLDDGVMINSAALWPLLEPQWKDPKKWWQELAAAKGKKDYDWAHLSARYFPTRVDLKCQEDPSLAVAHGRFWRYHPEAAYRWELRLQDEIGAEFTIDEADSDACRAAFLKANAAKADELFAAELKRRERKRLKAAQAADEGDGDEGSDEDEDEVEDAEDADEEGSYGPLFDAMKESEK